MHPRHIALLTGLGIILLALNVAPFSPLQSYRIVDESSRRLVERHVVVSEPDPGTGNVQLLTVNRTSVVGCGFAGPEKGWIDRWQVNLQQPGHLLSDLDVTGDGVSDLLMLSVTPDSSRWLECYDRAGEARGEPQPRWRAGPYLAGLKERRDGKIGLVAVRGVFDANADGRLELYVFLYPFAPGKLPRSLLALDGPTGRLLWFHDFAPVVEVAGLWASPEGPARHLVVIANHAPGNRFRVGDTTDFDLLVWALTPGGDEVWHRAVPAGEGASLWSSVKDYDGDGRKDYILVFRDPNASQGVPKSALLRLDPEAGGLTTIRDDLPYPASLVDHDLDGDGRPEMLWFGPNGTLTCLDHQFEVRWQATQPGLELIAGVGDLDDDGKEEILASGGRTVAVLSAATGRLLARRAYGQEGEESQEADTPPPSPQFAVYRVADHESIFMQTQELVRTARLHRHPGHPLLAPASFLIMMAAIVGVVADRRRQGAIERDLEAIDNEDRLLTAMTLYQHGGGSQRKLGRVGRLLKNWSDWDRHERARWEDIGDEFADYGDRLLPEIMGIAAIARRCALPPECWRTLAPNARALAAALKSLRPEVARLARPNGAGDDPRPDQTRVAADVSRAWAAFERVDDSLRFIRRELRRKHHCEVVAAVRRCVEQRRPDAHSGGASLRFKATCAPELKVHVSAGVLDKVMDNLIGNALRAVEHEESREITITVTATETSCRIDVADTGCGLLLEPEKWERVFDRDYSTRRRGADEEPGGAGLHYARERLAAFGGRIAVLDSTPGRGATFTVILQRSEE